MRNRQPMEQEVLSRDVDVHEEVHQEKPKGIMEVAINAMRLRNTTLLSVKLSRMSKKDQELTVTYCCPMSRKMRMRSQL